MRVLAEWRQRTAGPVWLTAQLQFQPQDLWLGVYWKTQRSSQLLCWVFFICLVPCFPLRLDLSWSRCRRSDSLDCPMCRSRLQLHAVAPYDRPGERRTMANVIYRCPGCGFARGYGVPTSGGLAWG